MRLVGEIDDVYVLVGSKQLHVGDLLDRVVCRRQASLGSASTSTASWAASNELGSRTTERGVA